MTGSVQGKDSASGSGYRNLERSMKKPTPPQFIAAALVVAHLASDEQRFALAVRQWKRKRTPGSLFHVVTSGVFLARDLAALP